MLALGLLGRNIAYSKSPILHNHWLKRYNIPGEYRVYDIAPTDLPAFLKSLPHTALTGLNVTIPYKQHVFPFFNHQTPNALKAQAINTLTRQGADFYGDNTDVLGCLDIFQQLDAPPIRTATLFGNGGAAKAVIAALKQLQPIDIRIVCRQQPDTPDLNVTYYNWQNQAAAVDGADLLINCTPLGLRGVGNPLEVDVKILEKMRVMDLIYTPHLTPFLQTALQAGAKVIDGLELLIRQAQHSFFLWTTVFPDIDADLRKKLLTQV